MKMAVYLVLGFEKWVVCVPLFGVISVKSRRSGDIQRSVLLEPLHQVRVSDEGSPEPDQISVPRSHSFVPGFPSVAATDEQWGGSVFRETAMLGHPGEVVQELGEFGLRQVDVRQVELVELSEQVGEESLGVGVGPGRVVDTEWRDSDGRLVGTDLVDDSLGHLQQQPAPVLHGTSILVCAVVDGILHE